ncbi:MAG: hypothetical protein EU541_00745 [Promethearchaeota archaeon]|nr:MAG: hypothetical protein EU541_00745 [Candidatus Lokiarchaeota archaeon]
MILKNGKIYNEGTLRKGIILIESGIISHIRFDSQPESLEELKRKNQDNQIIDCKNKIILPGIIDIHAHLRDMGQSYKETFQTGTKAAAYSGITTIFNMPNTVPPATSPYQVRKWMKKAEKNIFSDVGFIAGIPPEINYDQMKEIVELGVIGFKIYPLSPLSPIIWTDSENIQQLLGFSSEFQKPIFIHPDWPLTHEMKEEQVDIDILKLHNKLYPPKKEAKYVNFILENYYTIISDKDLKGDKYPLVHFCHISCKDSFVLIRDALNKYPLLNISFEVTPHHLLLSNEIKLKNKNYGKVLPPLRAPEHSRFLFEQLNKNNISLIGTDHAPHTIKEKSENYYKAPSGFPGFETYPLMLLDKVCKYQLSLSKFVSVASENPAKRFNLKNKGFIKEGYDADLLIIDRISSYPIEATTFYSKAKFSPFNGSYTEVQVWKVFLRGIEINKRDQEPTGRIIKKTH